VTFAAEHALIDILHPDKVNLASLGNMTPHLHWHVVARFVDDAQFPAPIWAQPQRCSPEASLAQRRAALPGLDATLCARLATA
jgi:diadenosine tetraphosphate (Ap4A) HIT family hydrolase